MWWTPPAGRTWSRRTRTWSPRRSARWRRSSSRSRPSGRRASESSRPSARASSPPASIPKTRHTAHTYSNSTPAEASSRQPSLARPVSCSYPSVTVTVTGDGHTDASAPRSVRGSEGSPRVKSGGLHRPLILLHDKAAYIITIRIYTVYHRLWDSEWEWPVDVFVWLVMDPRIQPFVLLWLISRRYSILMFFCLLRLISVPLLIITFNVYVTEKRWTLFARWCSFGVRLRVKYFMYVVFVNILLQLYVNYYYVLKYMKLVSKTTIHVI